MPELLTSPLGELFHDYVTVGEEFWDTSGRSGRFQVEKLTRALTGVVDQRGGSQSDAIDYVLDCAQRRAAGHPPTVHIGGRGGSGSHWLAEMLHDLGPYADAGEVSYASPLVRRMSNLAAAQQAMLIDAVNLLHALPGAANAADLSLVNSRGTVNFLQLKRWEPGCFFVHLIRDPRDQCVSVTYRKPGARQLYPVAGGDDEFLRLMIHLNRASLLRVAASSVPPDFVVRYEELRAEPERVLLELSAAIGIPIPQETASQSAFEHRAENIRAGVSKTKKGNLYRGPRKGGWQQATTDAERRLLHAGLCDVIDITPYPLDDCSGKQFRAAPLAAEMVVDLGPDVILGELHARGPEEHGWARLCAAAGTITLPAGKEFRLRSAGGWTSGLAHLVHVPERVLSSLCLSGNQDVRDEDLRHLRLQTALRELDLSRTQLTDRSLEYLDALPQLRGLNLLGSAISPEAAAEFRGAHPDCEVAAGAIWSEQWRERGWLDDQFTP